MGCRAMSPRIFWKMIPTRFGYTWHAGLCALEGPTRRVGCQSGAESPDDGLRLFRRRTRAMPACITLARVPQRPPDGKLWFMPVDGTSVVDPRTLPSNGLPPPVQVEQIKADGKIYSGQLRRDACGCLPAFT